VWQYQGQKTKHIKIKSAKGFQASRLTLPTSQGFGLHPIFFLAFKEKGTNFRCSSALEKMIFIFFDIMQTDPSFMASLGEQP
jgi:hypothetical protein